VDDLDGQINSDEKSLGSMLAVAVPAIAIATLVDFACAWIPVIWITAVKYEMYTTCVGGVLLLFVIQRREIRRVLVLVAFVAAMGILYKIQWNTRKPFLIDLSRVQIGMTAEEVDRVMGNYINGSGIGPVGPFGADENGELKLSDKLIYRHSNDGAFNADWGVVELKNGRVSDVDFLPD
jgi:hypothetical protein